MQTSLSLDLSRDFTLEAIDRGFLLTQCFSTEERDDDDNRIYRRFRRAFTSARDLLDFLEEELGYPHRSRIAEQPSKLSQASPAGPRITHFTMKEGGEWFDYNQHFLAGSTPIFALQFEGGRTWDALLGWR